MEPPLDCARDRIESPPPAPSPRLCRGTPKRTALDRAVWRDLPDNGADPWGRHPYRHPSQHREGPGAMSRKGVAELKTYTGDFHREGDVWVAEVREVPQAHTYGRTLARTKEHLRDALALF